MKKIIIMIILIVMILLPYDKIYAFETKQYVNKNGITLTDKEYKFVNEFYGKAFFYNMNQDDYDWISILDVNNKEVFINTFYDIDTRGPFYSTGSKKISISKTCDTSKCTVLTNLTWLTNPIVRSYDVIGARFSGTSLFNNYFLTKVSSSSGVYYYSYDKVLSNGFGTSVLLPSSGTNIVVDQQFFTNPGGTIYASYQHATTNIPLSTSYYYNISGVGYGGVFDFYGPATGIYDGMGGVNI